ncbi:anhydro-N-acetylmuramic acid kinase [Oleiagrimonas citrea]|uniref:Anhydro-N-acetylmuramic acid kinase n=1 Tax=Oleiagrimonas citrea TaxID=1665687 RepID=A0A846ZPG1_9GAMM|nr:anhydro-N-acetylmuramic acid kinase [Oleiagrimonas citrea]NKZ40165.1 anhydro-N-acetylmuramic acid kinase [Oleiagrimonas citrea]
MPNTDAALYVGLISGTSADGIDAALCRFDPHTELVHARTHLWPDALREDILDISQGNRLLDLDAYGRLDVAVGQCFAEAVHQLLREADVLPSAVRAIGSHGQTVRHRIHGDQPFTLQIGDASVIAERTGIDTVADFRRADVAAGGQGAPLMPAFHAAVLGAREHVRGVLNLGGIANLSVLHPDGRVIGFDTGPANGLMDAWCALTYRQPYDRDGAIAASGKVDEALLAALLDDPYFALPAPKSTGREVFHLDWLRARGDIDAMDPADVQATLLELTVRSIADAVRREAAQIEDLVVCGGGVHNHALMQSLAEQLAPCRVLSSETLGVAPDHVESMGFAWLAHRRLRGETGNLPSVTGAIGPRLLGAIHAAPR